MGQRVVFFPNIGKIDKHNEQTWYNDTWDDEHKVNKEDKLVEILGQQNWLLISKVIESYTSKGNFTFSGTQSSRWISKWGTKG